MVLRGLGWLFLALAVSAVVHDGLAWATEGSFRLLTLGSLWSHLDLRSFSETQIALQRGATSLLWFWLVRPLLAIPVLPAFLALGGLLLWAGSRDAGAARGTEMAFLGSSRPRRRRSRGLS